MSVLTKSWAEVQYRLRNALGTAHGKAGTPAELLKYSDTNRRINNVLQGQYGAFIDLEYEAFIMDSKMPSDEAIKLWAWLPALKQNLEKYQLTMDDKQDARNEFLEAFMYQAKAKAGNGKNSLTIESGGNSQESEA